jgi:hypothetical protein
MNEDITEELQIYSTAIYCWDAVKINILLGRCKINILLGRCKNKYIVGTAVKINILLGRCKNKYIVGTL